MTKPEFDNRDREMLVSRLAAFGAVEGARVGDFCRMPDGELRRFTHDWGDSLQTNGPKQALGCFYLGHGYMDYSGALDPAIPRDRLFETDETKLGAAWFFHHNEHRASNGVYFEVPCRVFEYR